MNGTAEGCFRHFKKSVSKQASLRAGGFPAIIHLYPAQETSVLAHLLHRDRESVQVGISQRMFEVGMRMTAQHQIDMTGGGYQRLVALRSLPTQMRERQITRSQCFFRFSRAATRLAATTGSS